MTLEGNTLLQIQKWWDAIIPAFCQYLSTKTILPPYKSIRAELHNIPKFLLPPDTHLNYATAKENCVSLSISLRVHLVKDTTISSSKAPTSHVKLIKYINNNNIFHLLIAVVFSMIPQPGGLGTKAQDLVISFHVGE